MITYEPAKQLLVYVKNGKTKRKAKITPPVFDMVSSYYVYRQNPQAKFLVTSGKKEAEPKIVCKGHDKIKIAKNTYNVDICKLFVPIKGLLVSRDPKKPALIYLDRKRRVLILSKVPTRWGTITIKIKGVIYGQDNATFGWK